MKHYKYLIIGGGLTGDGAVRGIRELDTEGSIGMFSMEPDPPYTRPSLSKRWLFAKRFSVQERVGQQIADTLETMLDPHGVAVFLGAHHLCMETRGVREASPITRTTVWRGHYAEDPSLRAEFFTACGLQRNEK